MFGDPPDPNALTTDQVLDHLAANGVAFVEVEFSGGNDSGSIDQIHVTMADKEAPAYQIPSPGWTEIREEYRDGPHKNWIRYRLRPDLTVEQRLEEALEKPVYDVYGSFAGDFDVSGTVTWDVAERTCTMKRSETVWSDLDDVSF